MKKLHIYCLTSMLLLGVFFVGCGQGEKSTETSVHSMEEKDKEESPPKGEGNKTKEITSEKAASQILLENKGVKTKRDFIPEFFTQINDYDSLGRPHIRWIEFRDTSSGQLLKKIDIIEKDNPYFKAGIKINCVDENGPQIYYTLGKQANKNMVKRFLPEEQYNTIAEDFLYPMALSMATVNKVDNYLIVNYSFEWGGLEREWIRGEYIGHAVVVYDQKGDLKYSNINTPGDLSYISPTGDYLFFIENKYHDDWEKQTGCLSIFSKKKNDFIFSDCRIHSEWNLGNVMLKNFILFGNCKRDDSYCFRSLMFETKMNKFYLILKQENESFRIADGPYKLYNKKTKHSRPIDLSKFEILNKK